MWGVIGGGCWGCEGVVGTGEMHCIEDLVGGVRALAVGSGGGGGG